MAFKLPRPPKFKEQQLNKSKGILDDFAVRKVEQTRELYVSDSIYFLTAGNHFIYAGTSSIGMVLDGNIFLNPTQDVFVALPDAAGARRFTVRNSSPADIWGVLSTGDVKQAGSLTYTGVGTFFINNSLAILLESGTDVIVDLGDDAGARNFIVRDSNNTNKFTVDSDGNVGSASNISALGSFFAGGSPSGYTFTGDINTRIERASSDNIGIVTNNVTRFQFQDGLNITSQIIIPASTDTVDLGRTAQKFRDLHLSNEVIGPTYKTTALGGFAIQMINSTGAFSTVGNIVEINAAGGIPGQVTDSVPGSLSAIGVFLNVVPNGFPAWVVVSGIALVNIDIAGCAIADRIVTAGGLAPGLGTPNNNPAVAVHFQEIGHALTGAAPGGQAQVVLHFN